MKNTSTNVNTWWCDVTMKKTTTPLNRFEKRDIRTWIKEGMGIYETATEPHHKPKDIKGQHCTDFDIICVRGCFHIKKNKNSSSFVESL